MATPDRDPLEELLEAAGRAVQPTHPGWQQLPERLARTPQVSPRRRLRQWAALAAAAAILVALALWLSGLFTPHPAHELHAAPIVVERLDVELTVLSATETDGPTLYMPLIQKLGSQVMAIPEFGLGDARMNAAGLAMRDRVVQDQFIRGRPYHVPVRQVTGQALVKDHRMILNLQKGDNLVRFTDVAASIDPTSVRLVSSTDPAGTVVVEQNFEYDLANADALLKRYLDRKVVCIGKDGQESTGYLASYDPQGIVLASEPTPPPGQKRQRSTESLDRSQLRAIRLDEVPTDLLVKPTLVWKLRARTPGKHDTTLSYLCGLIKWHADYVAVVTPGQDRQPDLVDITGWVSLDNTSGATYEKAGLKLIAGDVNRVRDPWAVLERLRWEETWESSNKRPRDGVSDGRQDNPKKEFVEKSFFEYKMYTLSAPSTIRDRQVKQLNLMQRTGVKASRRYVYDPAFHGNRASIELVVKNVKENNLGLPLPKGRVAFEQHDIDGDTALLGRVEIDHTAVKEEMTLRYGEAFEVIGEERQLDHKTLSERHHRATWEVRVRNHKSEEIQVRVVRRLGVNWEITKSSLPYQKHDYQTIYYHFALKPNAEQVITYVVDYHF